MNLQLTSIPGLVVVESDIFADSRGFFIEQFQSVKLAQLGFSEVFNIKQINFVKNNLKGTLRGLHAEPWSKYVSVISGKAFGAWVDIRHSGSPQVFTCELSPGRAVFVPQGVANSYQTLEDETYYIYAVSETWNPDAVYIGINPFDSNLNIPWPIAPEQSILSDKDMRLPNLKNIL